MTDELENVTAEHADEMTDEEMEQIGRICRLVENMAGEDIGLRGEYLVVAARSVCMSLCGRQDMPPAMEPVAALLGLHMWQKRDGDAKTIQRGDTSVTYENDEAFYSRFRALLTPFCRLGRVT